MYYKNIEATKYLGKLKDAFLKSGYEENVLKEQFDHAEQIQGLNIIRPLTNSVPHHTEITQSICRANQLTSFSMMGNIGR